MSILPALDVHAHIQPTVAPRDLVALKALIFAMTSRTSEWSSIQQREDELTLWGIGCHPRLPEEITEFSSSAFRDALPAAALVGEVGLDARSEASMAEQHRVFNEILEAVAAKPRPISIHSAAASADVLDALERQPQRGAILHWWRGSRSETERAVELGCFFSLNGAETRRSKVLGLLPPERILTETDYPHTQRHDPAASRPGSVETIERALEGLWDTDRASVRRQLWSNLASLFFATDSMDLVPAGLRQLLLAAAATR